MNKEEVHVRVIEENGFHNCPECAETDIKLERIKWIDTGDENIILNLVLKCRKENRPFEIYYECKFMDEDAIANVLNLTR